MVQKSPARCVRQVVHSSADVPGEPEIADFYTRRFNFSSSCRVRSTQEITFREEDVSWLNVSVDELEGLVQVADAFEDPLDDLSSLVLVVLKFCL